MKKLLVLCTVLALIGCGSKVEQQFPVVEMSSMTVDQCLRPMLFEHCMQAVVMPLMAKGGDVAEVVRECRTYARELSERRDDVVTKNCSVTVGIGTLKSGHQRPF